MIKINEFEVTPENVGKVVSIFKSNYLNRLQRLHKYYNGDNDIKNIKDFDKKTNKLPHPYARYITTIQTGYFMGENVKHISSNEEYLEAYQKILDDNFEEDVNFELAKAQSIYGHSAEVIYVNEKGEIKFKKLDSRECIFIFGTRLDEFLLAVIRIYSAKGLSDDLVEYAEVYTDREIIEFKRNISSSLDNDFKEIGREEHKFNEIPIILYKNNEEMKSDFEDILYINDAYDTAQSNTANDVDYFNDAYLVVNGANNIADTEEAEDGARHTAEQLKEGRVMFFPEAGGGASFLTKDINDSATENYKKRLNSDAHKFSLTPDLADENFAGNLSGVAIKFKTIPLEQNAKPKENKFRTGLKKRRELITFALNIKTQKNYDYKEITEEFSRNLPVNALEETQRILAIAPHVSKRTLLELLPEISDVDDELRRIEAEQDYEQRDVLFGEQIEKDFDLKNAN